LENFVPTFVQRKHPIQLVVQNGCIDIFMQMLINVFENVPTILFFFLRTWWHKGKGGGIGWRQTRGGDADQRHPREGSAGSAVDRAGQARMEYFSSTTRGG
jgi:hypothetical protein